MALLAVLVVGACVVAIASLAPKDDARSGGLATSDSASGRTTGGISVANDKPKKKKRADSPSRAIEVAASTLVAEYHANEVGADARYQNRMVEVAGSVNSIGKDMLGSAYLSIGEPFADVHCSLGGSLQREIATLHPGQYVVVRGRVSGMTLGSPFLEDCVLRSFQR